MKLTLIGCGCGPDSLSAEARRAIEGAELLVGSPRLLEQFPGASQRIAARSGGEIEDALRRSDAQSAALLFSGDSGFYSGAAGVLERAEGTEIKVLPGLSSVQVLAARLKEPWQDWRLCSAHGRDCDAVDAVCGGRTVFFLTGGRRGPAALCRALTAAGLGFLETTGGEKLGTAEERITLGRAEDFARRDFAPLSVLLARPAPRSAERCPGFPDDSFLREEGVPMTKQEVRAVILAKLGVGPEDTCWDVGTGTGSVAVELALRARRVFSVERDEKALCLAEKNRRRFGAWNLRLVRGEAPEALRALPKPDAVFVGGSGGSLPDILREIDTANPAARLCAAAVTLETLHVAVETMKALGRAPELCQLSVSRSRKAGAHPLMTAQNPVWLITGAKA